VLGTGTITVTEETKAYGEKHVPVPFCLPKITHGAAAWWQIENSILSAIVAKKKNSLQLELNPKLQPTATHFTNPADLETSNLT
jgi:hypothetical protein